MDGFRNIYCTHCRWYGRANHLHCTCGIPWYLCKDHTADPLVHRSKRPPNKKLGKTTTAKEVLCSTRPTPTVRGYDSQAGRKRVAADRKNLQEHRQNVEVTRIAVSASTLASWNKRRRLLKEAKDTELLLQSRKRKAEGEQGEGGSTSRRSRPDLLSFRFPFSALK